MQNTKKINPACIKALALDLDGTALTPETRLGGRTLRVLKACLSRGIAVILCTGRSVEGAEPYRAALDARGPMVYFNGAKVADMPGGTVLGLSLLDKEAADFCVDLSRKMGVYFQIYFPGRPELPGGLGPLPDRLIAERRTGETEMYRNHTGVEAEIGDLKEALADQLCPGCIKGMFITTPAQQEFLRPLLVQQFGGKIYVTRTHVSFLEVMSPGVSKGRGLKLAMDHLGLSPGELIALGDEENDLPLFETAGFSAAPANAKPPVLAAADFRIGSNAEEGVAAFLEDIFFGGSPGT
ncbi:MAG: Cof-type HAD-IIB family hydrolase [Spirochaetaceae bacterium]|jgi:hydroxymethylpyrimidine pyrophosphatase-like HAD family hydrolase|nr:Cof-type HAD-IIB family hydrolase [Spirochaetaceae bacterium]